MIFIYFIQKGPYSVQEKHKIEYNDCRIMSKEVLLGHFNIILDIVVDLGHLDLVIDDISSEIPESGRILSSFG